MELDDGGMNMGNNTPHFIAIDETNGFWFVSTISSGYIARYDLETNQLIDKIFVDDSPAILTLNEQNKKLYCSRMMAMGGMMDGAESTIIQEIDYSGTSIINSNEFIIPSPAPHGISINADGSEVYVSSNTADWLYKIITETGEVIGVVMDTEISNPSEIETHRLKPIQCLSVSDSLLFVTCSGGIWVDPWTGQQEQISGKVQLWNSNSMSLIDTYEFDWNSSPWHIINSPVSEKVYVALSGDQLYEGSAGVVELDYSNSILSQSWLTSHEIFQSLHGIDISQDGETIFVSGRADGHLHIIDTEMGELQNSIPLSTNPSMVMAGGVATVKNSTYLLGDVNNDSILDILDIVLMVNYILNSEVIFTQVADMNCDGIIDILDIVNLVNIILQ
jgi:DNA-binding beta-propeller fold protein YncE